MGLHHDLKTALDVHRQEFQNASLTRRNHYWPLDCKRVPSIALIVS